MQEERVNLLKAIEIMNSMAGDNLISYGINFVTAVDKHNKYVLRINYLSFYDEFVKYASEKFPEQHIYNFKIFKKLLSDMDFCIAESRTASFYVDHKKKARKNYRAGVFDIEKLKQAGINIEFLIRSI